MKIEISTDLIKQIANELDFGMRCFINIKTGSLITYPDDDNMPYADESLFKDDIKEVKKNKRSYREIEKMRSKESFEIMEEFINQVNDKYLQQRLMDALEGKKPFANFKMRIDDAGDYRQKWFDFKNMKQIEWVQQQLQINDGNNYK